MTIETASGRFSALAWGPEDAPVLLALHGWLDNAASFTRLAPLLSQYRIIALDLAGHGESDHRGAGADYPLWAYIPDVLTVADRLGLQKLDILGHSLGGIIGSILAATHPERVSSLVMIDGLWPVAGRADAIVEQLRRAIGHRSRSGAGKVNRFESVAKAVRTRRMAGFGKISEQAAEIIVRRALKPDNGGWVWRSDSRLLAPTAMRLTPEQSAALIKAIEAPSLLIVAKGGLTAGMAAKNSDKLRHIQIEELDGQHHLHLEDEVGDVARVIQQFLARIRSDIGQL